MINGDFIDIRSSPITFKHGFYYYYYYQIPENSNFLNMNLCSDLAERNQFKYIKNTTMVYK